MIVKCEVELTYLPKDALIGKMIKGKYASG